MFLNAPINDLGGALRALPSRLGHGLESAGQALVQTAEKWLGQPYVWGGGHGGTQSKPGGVDCSGLVTQACRQLGLNGISGTAAQMQQKGVPVAMNQLQPGDLVFMGQPAHHVGIYMGNGKVIEAPHHGAPVRVTSLAGFTSARRVVGANQSLPVPQASPAADQNATQVGGQPTSVSLPTGSGAPSAPAPSASAYTVKPGDSYWKIAEKLYGDGSLWPEIYAANKDGLSDPARLLPGQSLKLPGAPTAVAA